MAFTHLPLRRTAPIGIVAYVVGYLLTVGATAGRVGEVMAVEISGTYANPTPLVQIIEPTPPSWVVSGWLFYNTHFVLTSLPTADAVNGVNTLTNRSLLSTLGGPLIALYLVPPLLLLAGGYLAVRTGETRGANGPRNAGASIAVGYVPAFVLGAFVLTASASNANAIASPAGVPAIFLGLVYPVVFGAIGGLLADWYGTPESETPGEEVRTE